MATLRKIGKEHFRHHQLPEMAKREMKVFIKECRNFIPWLDTEEMRPRLNKWLQSVMVMKLELFVSSQHHKLAFLPPGVPYDQNTMNGKTEDGMGPSTNEDLSGYRVKVCLSPALYKCIPEPELPDIDDPCFTVDNYKDALQESRNFFAEEPGKYQGWEKSVLVSPAIVFVEKYPEQVQVMPDHIIPDRTIPNQKQPRQVPRLRLTQRRMKQCQVVENGEAGNDDTNSDVVGDDRGGDKGGESSKSSD